MANTRVTIFKPVVIPEDMVALQTEKDVISDINAVIQYINNYPYIRVEYVQELMSDLRTKIAQSEEPNIEHAKRFLQYQGLINSVKKRSDFVLMMINQQARLQELLEQYWNALKEKGKKVTQQDIDNKKSEMQKLFAKFSKYDRFAHLTAEELAAVTLTIEALIVAIENSKAEIKSDQIKKIIEEKLNELIKSKAEIRLCMQQHLDMQVEAKKSREENQASTANTNNGVLDSGSTFDNSVFGGSVIALSSDASAESNDILVPLKKKVNELFGKEVIKVDDVPEDSTLHLNIPPIPLGNTRVPNLTVGGFFQERVASQSPQPQPKQERTSYLAKYLPDWSMPNIVNVSALSASIGSWFKTLNDYVVDPVVNLVVVTAEQVTYAAKSLKEKILPSQPESLSYIDQIHAHAEEIRVRNNARKEGAEFVKVPVSSPSIPVVNAEMQEIIEEIVEEKKPEPKQKKTVRWADLEKKRQPGDSLIDSFIKIEDSDGKKVGLREKRRNVYENISQVMGTLTYFVDQYLDRPNMGFFNRHGEHGKRAAIHFQRDWLKFMLGHKDTFRQLINTSTSEEDLHKKSKTYLTVVQKKFHELMGSDYLDGNYNRHSLKTYLLAFDSYLSDIVSKNTRAPIMVGSGLSEMKRNFARHYTRGIEKGSFDPDIAENVYTRVIESHDRRMQASADVYSNANRQR